MNLFNGVTERVSDSAAWSEYNYYIVFKDLLRECDKAETVDVSKAATASCFKRNFKTFYPKPHIRPITARLAPQ
jgi:hypothetical protein